MIVLAADTTTSINTVAASDDGRVLAETVVECGRKHSERLLSTVEWVLDEAGLSLEDIQLLAVSAGPGSFTGVRIGMAAWKGLAVGLGLPLIAVPTLDAMARTVEDLFDGLVCTLLDAKMGEVYGAVYRTTAGQRVKVRPERACQVERLTAGLEGPTCFVGDGAQVYRARIEASVPGAVFAGPAHLAPRAGAVAAEALAMLAAGAPTDPGDAAPVYLRKSQAETALETKSRVST
jgi:tRNA threonylcarbamoyladenosine biosynthesis protein TsaB